MSCGRPRWLLISCLRAHVKYFYSYMLNIVINIVSYLTTPCLSVVFS